MKLGVVIFPSKNLQDLVNSYRKRYDPHYSLIPPHVTIKGPFEANENDLPTLVAQLRSVAMKFQPFSYHISKVKTFQPLNQVVYFKVDPNDTLTSINQALHQPNIIGGGQEYAFVPHITVAQGLSNLEHNDVYGALNMLAIDQDETADRFHLLYQLENGSWTVYETFLLGKE